MYIYIYITIDREIGIHTHKDPTTEWVLRIALHVCKKVKDTMAPAEHCS